MTKKQLEAWETKLRYEFDCAVDDARKQIRDEEPEPGQILLRWDERAFEA